MQTNNKNLAIRLLLIALIALAMFVSNRVHAAEPSTRPKVSIIIDDMGNNLALDSKVVNLPGPVVCSILPYGHFTKTLTAQAKQQQKEIILHIPMQAMSRHVLGLGGLSTEMDKDSFVETLQHELEDHPDVSGVSNHMGSLLTQDSEHMEWFMDELAKHNLFFVDSKTECHSVAEKTAQAHHIPTVHRNVFLDNKQNYDAIDAQFQELIRVAKQYGQAVAIGHPYPVTLRYLQKAIPKLVDEGIDLVPVSHLLHKN